jgi:hypothetical protein
MVWFQRKAKMPTTAVAEQYFYHFQQTRQLTAGAMAYAFVPTRLLPPVDMVGGTPFRGLRPLPPAPYVVQRAGVMNGLGGTIAGQMVLQPLSVPANAGGNL